MLLKVYFSIVIILIYIIDSTIIYIADLLVSHISFQ